MSNRKDLEAPDSIKILSNLAMKGASKAFNIDLVKLEKVSGRPTSPSGIMAFAMLGAESEEEVAFVKAAMSELKAES